MLALNPPIIRQKSRLTNLLGAGAVLLDVRTPEEYVGFHFEKALNIPYNQIDNCLPMIRQWNKPVIVYSTYGRRSRIAATKLKNAGIDAFDAGKRDDLYHLLLTL